MEFTMTILKFWVSILMITFLKNTMEGMNLSLQIYVWKNITLSSIIKLNF